MKSRHRLDLPGSIEKSKSRVTFLRHSERDRHRSTQRTNRSSIRLLRRPRESICRCRLRRSPFAHRVFTIELCIGTKASDIPSDATLPVAPSRFVCRNHARSMCFDDNEDKWLRMSLSTPPSFSLYFTSVFCCELIRYERTN